MDVIFLSLLCKLLAFRACAVVGIVDDDLSSRVEEVPDQLLTSR